MTTSRIKYGSPGTVTITLASLAANNDPNFGHARQSTVIDNSSNIYQDILIGGKLTTGATPADGALMFIWAFGSYDGTSFPAGLGSSDANIDFSPDRLVAYLDLIQTIVVSGDANFTYFWGPVSLANAFGGALPQKWGIVVQNHDTINGSSLDSSSSNHEVKYTPIQYEDL